MILQDLLARWTSDEMESPFQKQNQKMDSGKSHLTQKFFDYLGWFWEFCKDWTYDCDTGL